MDVWQALQATLTALAEEGALDGAIIAFCDEEDNYQTLYPANTRFTLL